MVFSKGALESKKGLLGSKKVENHCLKSKAANTLALTQF